MVKKKALNVKNEEPNIYSMIIPKPIKGLKLLYGFGNLVLLQSSNGQVYHFVHDPLSSRLVEVRG